MNKNSIFSKSYEDCIRRYGDNSDSTTANSSAGTPENDKSSKCKPEDRFRSRLITTVPLDSIQKSLETVNDNLEFSNSVRLSGLSKENLSYAKPSGANPADGGSFVKDNALAKLEALREVVEKEPSHYSLLDNPNYISALNTLFKDEVTHSRLQVDLFHANSLLSTLLKMDEDFLTINSSLENHLAENESNSGVAPNTSSNNEHLNKKTELEKKFEELSKDIRVFLRKKLGKGNLEPIEDSYVTPEMVAGFFIDDNNQVSLLANESFSSYDNQEKGTRFQTIYDAINYDNVWDKLSHDQRSRVLVNGLLGLVSAVNYRMQENGDYRQPVEDLEHAINKHVNKSTFKRISTFASRSYLKFKSACLYFLIKITNSESIKNSRAKLSVKLRLMHLQEQEELCQNEILTGDRFKEYYEQDVFNPDNNQILSPENLQKQIEKSIDEKKLELASLESARQAQEDLFLSLSSDPQNNKSSCEAIGENINDIQKKIASLNNEIKELESIKKNNDKSINEDCKITYLRHMIPFDNVVREKLFKDPALVAKMPLSEVKFTSDVPSGFNAEFAYSCASNMTSYHDRAVPVEELLDYKVSERDLELQKQSERIEMLEQGNQDLRDRLRRKNAQLMETCDTLDAKNNELEAKSNELEAKNNELEAKSNELEAKNNELEAKNNQIINTVTFLQKALEESRKKYQKLSQKMEDLRQQKGLDKDSTANQSTQDLIDNQSRTIEAQSKRLRKDKQYINTLEELHFLRKNRDRVVSPNESTQSPNESQMAPRKGTLSNLVGAVRNLLSLDFLNKNKMTTQSSSLLSSSKAPGSSQLEETVSPNESQINIQKPIRNLLDTVKNLVHSGFKANLVDGLLNTLKEDNPFGLCDKDFYELQKERSSLISKRQEIEAGQVAETADSTDSNRSIRALDSSIELIDREIELHELSNSMAVTLSQEIFRLSRMYQAYNNKIVLPKIEEGTEAEKERKIVQQFINSHSLEERDDLLHITSLIEGALLRMCNLSALKMSVQKLDKELNVCALSISEQRSKCLRPALSSSQVPGDKISLSSEQQSSTAPSAQNETTVSKTDTDNDSMFETASENSSNITDALDTDYLLGALLSKSDAICDEKESIRSYMRLNLAMANCLLAQAGALVIAGDDSFISRKSREREKEEGKTFDFFKVRDELGDEQQRHVRVCGAERKKMHSLHAKLVLAEEIQRLSLAQRELSYKLVDLSEELRKISADKDNAEKEIVNVQDRNILNDDSVLVEHSNLQSIKFMDKEIAGLNTHIALVNQYMDVIGKRKKSLSDMIDTASNEREIRKIVVNGTDADLQNALGYVICTTKGLHNAELAFLSEKLNVQASALSTLEEYNSRLKLDSQQTKGSLQKEGTKENQEDINSSMVVESTNDSQKIIREYAYQVSVRDAQIRDLQQYDVISQALRENISRLEDEVRRLETANKSLVNEVTEMSSNYENQENEMFKKDHLIGEASCNAKLDELHIKALEVDVLLQEKIIEELRNKEFKRKKAEFDSRILQLRQSLEDFSQEQEKAISEKRLRALLDPHSYPGLQQTNAEASSKPEISPSPETLRHMKEITEDAIIKIIDEREEYVSSYREESIKSKNTALNALHSVSKDEYRKALLLEKNIEKLRDELRSLREAERLLGTEDSEKEQEQKNQEIGDLRNQIQEKIASIDQAMLERSNITRQSQLNKSTVQSLLAQVAQKDAKITELRQSLLRNRQAKQRAQQQLNRFQNRLSNIESLTSAAKQKLSSTVGQKVVQKQHIMGKVGVDEFQGTNDNNPTTDSPVVLRRDQETYLDQHLHTSGQTLRALYEEKDSEPEEDKEIEARNPDLKAVAAVATQGDARDASGGGDDPESTDAEETNNLGRNNAPATGNLQGDLDAFTADNSHSNSSSDTEEDSEPEEDKEIEARNPDLKAVAAVATQGDARDASGGGDDPESTDAEETNNLGRNNAPATGNLQGDLDTFTADNSHSNSSSDTEEGSESEEDKEIEARNPDLKAVAAVATQGDARDASGGGDDPESTDAEETNNLGRNNAPATGNLQGDLDAFTADNSHSNSSSDTEEGSVPEEDKAIEASSHGLEEVAVVATQGDARNASGEGDDLEGTDAEETNNLGRNNAPATGNFQGALDAFAADNSHGNSPSATKEGSVPEEDKAIEASSHGLEKVAAVATQGDAPNASGEGDDLEGTDDNNPTKNSSVVSSGDEKINLDQSKPTVGLYSNSSSDTEAGSESEEDKKIASNPATQGDAPNASDEGESEPKDTKDSPVVSSGDEKINLDQSKPTVGLYSNSSSDTEAGSESEEDKKIEASNPATQGDAPNASGEGESEPKDTKDSPVVSSGDDEKMTKMNNDDQNHSHYYERRVDEAFDKLDNEGTLDTISEEEEEEEEEKETLDLTRTTLTSTMSDLSQIGKTTPQESNELFKKASTTLNRTTSLPNLSSLVQEEKNSEQSQTKSKSISDISGSMLLMDSEITSISSTSQQSGVKK